MPQPRIQVVLTEQDIDIKLSFADPISSTLIKAMQRILEDNGRFSEALEIAPLFRQVRRGRVSLPDELTTRT